MIFENKQKAIEQRIGLYCDSVLQCLDVFKRSILEYCESPDRARIKAAFTEIHRAESRADDIRREIEVMMYSKTLFPESRGDILGLLESMDRVPNKAESVIRTIGNERVKVPPEFCAAVKQLTDVCCRSVVAMVDAARKLFESHTQATVAIGRIDELESEADRIESDLIDRAFSTDMPGIDKILFRDLVKHISEVSDRAENVGDRIGVIVAKRRT